MMSLFLFAPFQPTPGLAIWSLLIFSLFWFVMGRTAFKPITEALKKREDDIQSALDEAKKAREEMSNLQAENESLLQQAREERTALLNEAKDMKTKIIAEAREKAKAEATKIVTDAKQEIEVQKKAALAEVKNTAGMMALDIAEKVIRKDLKGNPEQEAFVSQLITEISSN
ncbi:MAG: F0F1 ATP synthase subunit B [Bacteroidota bacterium]